MPQVVQSHQQPHRQARSAPLLDSEGWFRSRTEYRYVEQSIGEDFDYTEDTTTQYFLWSTVLGAIVAELDNAGDQTTGFVFAGQRIASLEITPSNSAVYFRNVDPQTGTTYRTDYTGKGGRNEEFDPLGAQIPKTDPYITQNRLYTDLKPAGKLFMNDASPFSYDNSCSLDGIPTPCGIAQRLGASGAADALVEADVYIRYTSGRIDRYSGKVTAALAGINVVWKGADARAAAAGFFSALPGGLESAINAAFNNVYISRNDRVPENNGVPRNYAHASPQDPVHDVVSPNDCYGLVSEVRHIAERTHVYLAGPKGSDMVQNFMDQLARRFTEFVSASELGIAFSKVGVTSESNHKEFSDVGFKTPFEDHIGPGATDNQVRHAVGGLIAGYLFGDGDLGRGLMDRREDMNTPSGQADTRLNRVTMPMGAQLRGAFGGSRAANLAEWIKNTLCNPI